MELNAFVVMPFGTKSPRGFNEAPNKKDPKTSIDFNDVWHSLFFPALKQAGCKPFRADSETLAGDIRTDMFFELVTADVVLADVTISNPNVFYELGVRHGVCSRGVFVATGNLTPGRAFDIAQDRSFSYDGTLFLESAAKGPERDKLLDAEVKKLTTTLIQAIAGDQETVGSPVYSHLPGLVPADWSRIQTSRAQHFHTLQDDWLDRVRKAQAEEHPGDILTLADDAPTRLHRTKILKEAAAALINMCRYSAAEKVLREITPSQPDPEAQLQLARALSLQGDDDGAEHELRNILKQHEDDPDASDLLGQVLRHLWRLSWKNAADEDRIQRALDNAQLADMAIANFIKAFRSDANAYYAGLNALILGALLKHIRPVPEDSGALDIEELKAVIAFVARNARERAIAVGDYVEQFWATTTLAGIAMLRQDHDAGLARIREALCIPGKTSFQIQSFEDRLALLSELNFESDFVGKALTQVRSVKRSSHCTCERVILYSGYKLADPKLTEARLALVGKQISQAVEKDWEVHEKDLAICDGATEAGILFSEACLGRGASVRLMLLDPDSEESGDPRWPFPDPQWLRRFHSLINQRDRVEVWYHSKHFGTQFAAPVQGDGDDPPDDAQKLITHYKQWIRHTARIEADIAEVAGSNEIRHGELHGLFVCDRKSTGEDPNDPAYLIRYVNSFDGYRGEVKIIDPQELDQELVSAATN